LLTLSVGHSRAIAGALGLVIALALPAAAGAHACLNAGGPGTYEGFGAGTVGGAGRPIHRVTTLADSGPGSLREALRAGNRCVVFDVAGDIVLHKQLYVQGAFVTVDGFTAPPPGITLRDYGLAIWGSRGAHDVVVRGVRIRDAGQKTCTAGSCWDGIQIKNGAQRVVIDHVSIDNASDGALDITSQVGTLSQDITVQWSIMSGTLNQVGIGRSTRISMHHNLFVNGKNRNPEAGWDVKLTTLPPDTVLDFRNNVVWNYTDYGTIVRWMATANVVGNFYLSPMRPTAARALVIDRQGRVHAAGNFSGTGADVDARGTEPTAFPARAVSTTDACQAAADVRDRAGARGPAFVLDAIDREHITRIAAALEGSRCAADQNAAGPRIHSRP
jgi:hypothetical protein